MPAWFYWFTAIQTVIMALAAIFAGSLRQGFKVGRWAQGIDYGPRVTALETRMDARERTVDKRFEEGGEKMSDLATCVNGMPERLRRDFVTREEQALISQESKNDRERIWAEIRGLWELLRQRRPGR